MKVYISDASVFEEVECFDSLLQFFIRVRGEYHQIVLEDIDALRRSAFFSTGLPEYQRREWLELVERLAFEQDFLERTRESGSRPKEWHAEVVIAAGDSRLGYWEVEVLELGRWSQQSLRLILEADDDFSLLVGAARAEAETAPGEMSWLEQARARGALRVDGRGGCGNVLVTLRSYPAADRLRDRVFVVVDSDRESSVAALKMPQTGIQAAEKDFRYGKVFILQKREVENYIPDAQIQEWSQRYRGSGGVRVRAYRAWRQAAEERKDYMDLKEHFTEGWIQGALSGLPASGGISKEQWQARCGDELWGILSAIKERL